MRRRVASSFTHRLLSGTTTAAAAGGAPQRGKGAIAEFMRSKEDEDASEEWAALAARGFAEGPHGELSAAAKADVARVLETVYGPKRALEKASELRALRLTPSIASDDPLAPLVEQYRRTLEHNAAYTTREGAQAVLEGLERGLAKIEAEAVLEGDDDWDSDSDAEEARA
jgi:hypothetical protein